MSKTQKTEAMDFTDVTEDQTIWYVGGRFPTNGTWQEWQTTLANSSMPTYVSA